MIDFITISKHNAVSCQISGTVTTRVSVLTSSFSKNSCNVQRITRKCNANEKLTITHITEVKMSV